MAKINKEKLIYISLKEASSFCRYAQEYLSLRARQGKLKSVKFGKNWVTTKEWLSEYIQKTEKYNSSHNGNGDWVKNIEETKALSPILAVSAARGAEVKKIKIIKVPKNLPIEKESTPHLRLAFALIAIIILAGGFFTQRVFFNNIPKNINPEIITADLRGKTNEYLYALFGGLNVQFTNFKTRILLLRDFFNNKPSNENNKEGMVVVSSSEENEAMKIKIQKSFSDEVKVEPKDESSGIITPVFQKGDGEQYLYIMVPIKN